MMVKWHYSTRIILWVLPRTTGTATTMFWIKEVLKDLKTFWKFTRRYVPLKEKKGKPATVQKIELTTQVKRSALRENGFSLTSWKPSQPKIGKLLKFRGTEQKTLGEKTNFFDEYSASREKDAIKTLNFTWEVGKIGKSLKSRWSWKNSEHREKKIFSTIGEKNQAEIQQWWKHNL